MQSSGKRLRVNEKNADVCHEKSLSGNQLGCRFFSYGNQFGCRRTDKTSFVLVFKHNQLSIVDNCEIRSLQH